MADISDVNSALVAIVAQAIYPNGTAQASVVAAGVRIYPGWPNPQQLDADVKVGVSHVSVYPRAEERNTTRYSKDWQQRSLAVATITATVNAQTIVIAGAMPVPFTAHVVSILVNGKVYPYQVLSTDTLAMIATALAALIAVDRPGTAAASGVVTLPSSASITAARVGVTGTSIREIRRQERVFQITVWASTPAQRDVIGAALDIALAATEFLTMPDGYAARLIYRNSHLSDDMQKSKLYRRDFQYSVEYATTQTATDTQITQEQVGLALQNDGATQYTAARITYS
jgi:hypothetical protein